MTTMLRPRSVVAAEHDSYEVRFGQDFAFRMTRGSWIVIVGAWIMVLGLIGMIVIGVAVFFASGSLPAVAAAMYSGFGVIVVGFVVNAIGVGLRAGPIKELSSRIIAFNPNVTPDGAKRLIRDPALYTRWMEQHPGFVAF